MTWLNASEHLAIDAATRHRVQELRSTASLAVAHDGGGCCRAAGWTTRLRSRAALVLGLIGLAAVSSVGCAAGTRSVAADADTSGAAWNASPADAPRTPTCQGMGSYNRAANLCVSDGL